MSGFPLAIRRITGVADLRGRRFAFAFTLDLDLHYIRVAQPRIYVEISQTIFLRLAFPATLDLSRSSSRERRGSCPRRVTLLMTLPFNTATITRCKARAPHWIRVSLPDRGAPRA